MAATSTATKRSHVQGAIHKRVPHRPASMPGDIYIANRSKTVAIVNRIKELLLNKKYPSVTIHAMGAMVLRATSIALAAQRELQDCVDLKPTTGTVALFDDIVPENMDEDIQVQERFNSAIHIVITPRAGLATLQKASMPMSRHPSRNRIRKYK